MTPSPAWSRPLFLVLGVAGIVIAAVIRDRAALAVAVLLCVSSTAMLIDILQRHRKSAE